MATKRPLVNNAGTLNEIATNDTLLASGFSIPSGTSSQFLKADGTADATTYTVNSEVTRASIRPSLLLDFANSKTLDPRITFTRNSTASYYGKDGLLKTAAINSPRFDHNPTTGESLGLLIEEQRTNLLLYSDTLSTQSVTTTATSYTLSFYGTGTVTLSGTYTGSLVGSGSYPTRSTLTFTATAGTLTLTITGSVTYAQLEAGAFPTSYIPSTDTFTSRATTGTYIGSNGLIQTAAINAARLNYNPLNLALSPKLLLESASTNLLTYSEQFDNAVWVKIGTATITANNATAPDGTLTADTLNLPTYSDRISPISGTTVSASSTYTGSVWLSGTGTIELSIANSNGTYAITTTEITLTLTPVRYTVTHTTSSTTTLVYFIIGRYNGTGTATSVIAWGAQLETGASSTSYIPTTSAQVTRAADVSSSAQSTRIADSAVMTGTNFSNWYRQDEGTFTTKSDSNYSTSSATEQIIYNVSDNSTSNFLNGSRINASNRFYGTTNAISQFDLTSGTYTTQSLHSNTYKLNSINASYNGAAVTTDTSAIIPSVNKITLGASTTGNYLNGHISKLAYYPKQLTNAELITLSTV